MKEFLGPNWTATKALKAVMIAQCALAGLVVVSDMLQGAFARPGATDREVQTTEVPVTPGDQMRQFTPNRLPNGAPDAPDFRTDGAVPRRLEFKTVQIEGYGDALRITGTIAEGDGARFEEWLSARETPPSVISLHSPGGSVWESLQIGRSIRAAELNTLVVAGDSCFSACPYILAGGAQRDVSRRAFVGVHQHYFDENTYLPAFLLVADIQSGQGEVMAYLNEMGIDLLLMSKGMMTPPDDVYILVPDELTTFALATTLTD
jgi:hypothetical protein